MCKFCEDCKQHGVNAIKNKEDIKMELSNVKDARRLPNGTSIAVDDVVRITISYNKELYSKFGNKNSVDGRIVRFCDKGFELDISERFNSNVVSLRYDNISCLYPAMEETKC